MSMSKLAVGGGWADLPRDLLESVLARLPVPDRVRFPAVCTAWQSAHAAAAARLRQATPSPWLMLPFNPTARAGGVDDDGGSAKLSVARFLSLAEGRAYAIRQPAPPARDRLCVGSSPDGWLVTADARSELSLLNPVTGAQLRLPPAATLPFVDARRGADGRVESYGLRSCFADGGVGCGDEALVPTETLAPDRLRYEVYEKAIVVSAPRRVPPCSCWVGYAVLLICQPLGRLAVARAGDAEWALLDDAGAPARCCWVDAVRASFSGAEGSRRDHRPVYTMDSAGRVDAWKWDTDAATTPSRAVAPPCGCSARSCAMSAACRKYLVELSPGRLLQVHRLREAAHAGYGWEPRPEHVEYTTTGVELFEWTAATGRWARADGRVLGGRALFLGKSASLCVPADDAGWCPGPGVRGGCVYFTDDGPWSHDRCHDVTPDVGVLDLADGSYRPPRGAARDLLWKWPPPVWVFPSLAG